MLNRNIFISANVLKFKKNVMHLSPCNVKYSKFCKFVKEIDDFTTLLMYVQGVSMPLGCVFNPCLRI